MIFAVAHLQTTQNFTIIEHEEHKLEMYVNLEPHDYKSNYDNIDLHHQYGISVVEAQMSLLQSVPSSGEQGETTVFDGLSYSDGSMDRTMPLTVTIPDPVAIDCVDGNLLKSVLDLCGAVKGGNLKSY